MIRNEYTCKIIAYCLTFGIGLGLVLCLFTAIASPKSLSSEEEEKYRQIAIQYYESGIDISDENIIVSSYSQHMVSVVNSEEPLEPSLSFKFEDDNRITVKTGLNMYVIKIFPAIFCFSVIGSILVAFVILLMSLFIPYQKERG